MVATGVYVLILEGQGILKVLAQREQSLFLVHDYAYCIRSARDTSITVDGLALLIFVSDVKCNACSEDIWKVKRSWNTYPSFSKLLQRQSVLLMSQVFNDTTVAARHSRIHLAKAKTPFSHANHKWMVQISAPQPFLTRSKLVSQFSGTPQKYKKTRNTTSKYDLRRNIQSNICAW